MLETATSFSFIAKVSKADRSLGITPKTRLIPGQRLAVKVSRPASLRIDDVSTKKDWASGRYFMGNPYNVFVSNGLSQLELARESNCYLLTSAATTFEGIDSHRGLPSLIAYEIVLAGEPLKG